MADSMDGASNIVIGIGADVSELQTAMAEANNVLAAGGNNMSATMRSMAAAMSVSTAAMVNGMRNAMADMAEVLVSAFDPADMRASLNSMVGTINDLNATLESLSGTLTALSASFANVAPAMQATGQQAQQTAASIGAAVNAVAGQPSLVQSLVGEEGEVERLIQELQRQMVQLVRSQSLHVDPNWIVDGDTLTAHFRLAFGEAREMLQVGGADMMDAIIQQVLGRMQTSLAATMREAAKQGTTAVDQALNAFADQTESGTHVIKNAADLRFALELLEKKNRLLAEEEERLTMIARINRDLPRIQAEESATYFMVDHGQDPDSGKVWEMEYRQIKLLNEQLDARQTRLDRENASRRETVAHRAKAIELAMKQTRIDQENQNIAANTNTQYADMARTEAELIAMTPSELAMQDKLTREAEATLKNNRNTLTVDQQRAQVLRDILTLQQKTSQVLGSTYEGSKQQADLRARYSAAENPQSTAPQLKQIRNTNDADEDTLNRQIALIKILDKIRADAAGTEHKMRDAEFNTELANIRTLRGEELVSAQNRLESRLQLATQANVEFNLEKRRLDLQRQDDALLERENELRSVGVSLVNQRYARASAVLTLDQEELNALELNIKMRQAEAESEEKSLTTSQKRIALREQAIALEDKARKVAGSSDIGNLPVDVQGITTTFHQLINDAKDTTQAFTNDQLIAISAVLRGESQVFSTREAAIKMLKEAQQSARFLDASRQISDAEFVRQREQILRMSHDEVNVRRQELDVIIRENKELASSVDIESLRQATLNQITQTRERELRAQGGRAITNFDALSTEVSDRGTSSERIREIHTEMEAVLQLNHARIQLQNQYTTVYRQAAGTRMNISHQEYERVIGEIRSSDNEQLNRLQRMVDAQKTALLHMAADRKRYAAKGETLQFVESWIKQFKTLGAELKHVSTGFNQMASMIRSTATETLNSISHYFENVRVMAEETSSSFEEAQQLVGMFGQYGVTASRAEQAIKMLARLYTEADERGGAALQKFLDMNISLGELRRTGGDMITMFEMISKKLQSIEDPLKRASAATALVGRSNTMVIPVLSASPQALHEAMQSSVFIKEKQAQEAMKIAAMFEQFKHKIEITLADIVVKMKPVIEYILGAMVELTESFSKLAEFMSGVFGIAVGFATADILKMAVYVGILTKAVTVFINVVGGVGSMIAMFMDAAAKGRAAMLAVNAATATAGTTAVVTATSFQRLAAAITMTSGPFMAVVTVLGLVAAATWASTRAFDAETAALQRDMDKHEQFVEHSKAMREKAHSYGLNLNNLTVAEKGTRIAELERERRQARKEIDEARAELSEEERKLEERKNSNAQKALAMTPSQYDPYNEEGQLQASVDNKRTAIRQKLQGLAEINSTLDLLNMTDAVDTEEKTADRDIRATRRDLTERIANMRRRINQEDPITSKDLDAAEQGFYNTLGSAQVPTKLKGTMMDQAASQFAGVRESAYTSNREYVRKMIQSEERNLSHDFQTGKELNLDMIHKSYNKMMQELDSRDLGIKSPEEIEKAVQDALQRQSAKIDRTKTPDAIKKIEDFMYTTTKRVMEEMHNTENQRKRDDIARQAKQFLDTMTGKLINREMGTRMKMAKEDAILEIRQKQAEGVLAPETDQHMLDFVIKRVKIAKQEADTYISAMARTELQKREMLKDNQIKYQNLLSSLMAGQLALEGDAADRSLEILRNKLAKEKALRDEAIQQRRDEIMGKFAEDETDIATRVSSGEITEMDAERELFQLRQRRREAEIQMARETFAENRKTYLDQKRANEEELENGKKRVESMKKSLVELTTNAAELQRKLKDALAKKDMPTVMRLRAEITGLDDGTLKKLRDQIAERESANSKIETNLISDSAAIAKSYNDTVASISSTRRDIVKDNYEYDKKQITELAAAKKKMTEMEKSWAQDAVSAAESAAEQQIDTYAEVTKAALEKAHLIIDSTKREEEIQKILTQSVQNEVDLRANLLRTIREAYQTEFGQIFDFLKEIGGLTTDTLTTMRNAIEKDITVLLQQNGAAAVTNKEFQSLYSTYKKVSEELYRDKKGGPIPLGAIHDGKGNIIELPGLSSLKNDNPFGDRLKGLLGGTIGSIEGSMKRITDNFTGVNGLAQSSGRLKSRFDDLIRIISALNAKLGATVDGFKNQGVTQVPKKADIAAATKEQPKEEAAPYYYRASGRRDMTQDRGTYHSGNSDPAMRRSGSPYEFAPTKPSDKKGNEQSSIINNKTENNNTRVVFNVTNATATAEVQNKLKDLHRSLTAQIVQQHGVTGLEVF